MTENNVSTNKTNAKLIIREFFVFMAVALVIVITAVLKLRFMMKAKIEFNAISYVLFSAVIVIILLGHFIYVVSSRRSLTKNLRLFSAIYTAIGLAVVSSVLLSKINPFLMPAMLAAFIVATMALGRDAFTANIFSNIIVLFILLTENYITDSSNYYAVVSKFAQGLTGGSIVAYWIKNSVKRLKFLLKGFLVALLSSVAVVAVVTAFNGKLPSFIEIGYLAAGTFGQVIVAMVLQPVLETVFNLVTNTRLVELTDHNAPLIKRLKEEAPGTFNHSLAVANFAEICAAAIGENPYLARACAYYHDVGKLANPQYFKENQGDINPHDGLLPEVSAEIIRNHATEGKKLCDEYRIPSEVSDITVQHHGTLPIYVFYAKAKQLTDSEVSMEWYSYHGKTPISKIAAIIMLCDSSEAAIRAMDDPDAERVDKLLRKIISERIEGGQFDNCDISMRDLDLIRQAIIDAFGGQFHKRLKYPDGK